MKVINLFGGPGVGKSTNAARLFALMKDDLKEVELIQEFAKDLTWEDRKALECQPYVSGKQIWKQQRMIGKVDYLITDSPIILGSVYSNSKAMNDLLFEEFDKFDNLNIFINRVKPFNPNGRNQTERESSAISKEIKQLLISRNIDFTIVNGDKEGIESFYNKYFRNELIQ